MSTCSICGKKATIRTDYARQAASMCNSCDHFVGKNFNALFDLQLHSRECNALGFLRNAYQVRKENIVLDKLIQILNLPRLIVFRKANKKKQKPDLSCDDCAKFNYISIDGYTHRIVEEKDNTYQIVCKHIAREMKTHTPCNYCGVRFFNENEIIKNARNIENTFGNKLLCLLCQKEETLLSEIHSLISI